MNNKNTKTAELVSLSHSLRALNLIELSDKINKSAEKIINIKTAQYVGIQGYWVRNRRCWENCYRQKRATKKELSAQQVWEECHDEYVASINNDYSGWEKYAGDNASIKTASKKAKHIFNKANSNFDKSLSNKLANGESLPVAVFASISEHENKYMDAMLVELNKLADTAVDLNKKGYNGLGEQLAALSVDMLKEAANDFGGNFLGDMWRSWTSKRKGEDPDMPNVQKRLQNILSGTFELISNVRNSFTVSQRQPNRSNHPQNEDTSTDKNMNDTENTTASIYNNKLSKISQYGFMPLTNIFKTYETKIGNEIAALTNYIGKFSRKNPEFASGLQGVNNVLINFLKVTLPKLIEYGNTSAPSEKVTKSILNEINNYGKKLQESINYAYMPLQQDEQDSREEDGKMSSPPGLNDGKMSSPPGLNDEQWNKIVGIAKSNGIDPGVAANVINEFYNTGRIIR